MTYVNQTHLEGWASTERPLFVGMVLGLTPDGWTPDTPAPVLVQITALEASTNDGGKQFIRWEAKLLRGTATLSLRQALPLSPGDLLRQTHTPYPQLWTVFPEAQVDVARLRGITLLQTETETQLRDTLSALWSALSPSTSVLWLDPLHSYAQDGLPAERPTVYTLATHHRLTIDQITVPVFLRLVSLALPPAFQEAALLQLAGCIPASDTPLLGLHSLNKPLQPLHALLKRQLQVIQQAQVLASHPDEALALNDWRNARQKRVVLDTHPWPRAYDSWLAYGVHGAAFASTSPWVNTQRLVVVVLEEPEPSACWLDMAHLWRLQGVDTLFAGLGLTHSEKPAWADSYLAKGVAGPLVLEGRVSGLARLLLSNDTPGQLGYWHRPDEVEPPDPLAQDWSPGELERHSPQSKNEPKANPPVSPPQTVDEQARAAIPDFILRELGAFSSSHQSSVRSQPHTTRLSSYQVPLQQAPVLDDPVQGASPPPPPPPEPEPIAISDEDGPYASWQSRPTEEGNAGETTPSDDTNEEPWSLQVAADWGEHPTGIQADEATVDDDLESPGETFPSKQPGLHPPDTAYDSSGSLPAIQQVSSLGPDDTPRKAISPFEDQAKEDELSSTEAEGRVVAEHYSSWFAGPEPDLREPVPADPSAWSEADLPNHPCIPPDLLLGLAEEASAEPEASPPPSNLPQPMSPTVVSPAVSLAGQEVQPLPESQSPTAFMPPDPITLSTHSEASIVDEELTTDVVLETVPLDDVLEPSDWPDTSAALDGPTQQADVMPYATVASNRSPIPNDATDDDDNNQPPYTAELLQPHATEEWEEGWPVLAEGELMASSPEQPTPEMVLMAADQLPETEWLITPAEEWEASSHSEPFPPESFLTQPDSPAAVADAPTGDAAVSPEKPKADLPDPSSHAVPLPPSQALPSLEDTDWLQWQDPASVPDDFEFEANWDDILSGVASTPSASGSSVSSLKTPASLQQPVAVPPPAEPPAPINAPTAAMPPLPINLEALGNIPGMPENWREQLEQAGVSMGPPPPQPVIQPAEGPTASPASLLENVPARPSEVAAEPEQATPPPPPPAQPDQATYWEGKRVQHDVYGTGTVSRALEMDGRIIVTVLFDQTGKRLLDPLLSNLDVLDG